MNKQLQTVIQSINNKELFKTKDVKDAFSYITNNDIKIEPKEERLLNIFKQYSYDELTELLNKQIIVSLTSFPERINTVSIVIDNIAKQTKQPDLVILWLAEDEFPNKEKDLPNQLLNNDKLQIEWCNNLLSHKKYLYAMKQYPESIIITIDDDLIYPDDMIEELYLSYLEHPEAISASRTHIMMLDEENNSICKYNDWIYESNYLINKPSLQLFATTGAGTLFPPHIIKDEFLDERLISKLCPTADDVWLKCAELLNDTPTVLAAPFGFIKTIPNTQDNSLYQINSINKGNNIQLNSIIEWVNKEFGTNYLINKLIKPNVGVDLNKKENIKKILIYYANKKGISNNQMSLARNQREKEELKTEYEHINKQYKELKRKNDTIVNSNLYKILVKIRKLKNTFTQKGND